MVRDCRSDAQAIREQGQEGGLVRCTYMNQKPYAPHYYLGVALKELGDCGNAMAEFEVAERQGAIRSMKREYADLEQNKNSCAARLPKAPLLAEAAPRVEVPIEAPRPKVEPPTEAPRANAVTPDRTPDEAGVPPPAIAAARSPAVSVQPAVPERPVKTVSVPPNIKRAAQAYFDGDYRSALTQLQSVDAVANIRVRAIGHLFVAAAQFAQLQLTGGRDTKLKRAAAAAVTACRRTDGSVIPEPDYFSPAFIRFFRNVQ
jgi:hypothetical protein